MEEKSLEERFWEKVNKTEACWIWTAYVTKTGYGIFSLPRYKKTKTVRAHRVSYQIHKGEIPAGMLVCHSCDNPSCVNPNHLFLGTEKDNMRDMINKGRHYLQRKTHCNKGHELTGENVYYHKGSRRCRTCVNERAKQYKREKAMLRKLSAPNLHKL